MKDKTLGMMISSLRKEKNMTQLELATIMNVTDKAVSKWERDLSCPDINSLAKLAECLGVSVDQLMQCQYEVNSENTIKKLTNIILKAIPVAMGVSVVVLTLLNEIDVQDALTMLGIGLACVGIVLLKNNDSLK